MVLLAGLTLVGCDEKTASESKSTKSVAGQRDPALPQSSAAPSGGAERSESSAPSPARSTPRQGAPRVVDPEPEPERLDQRGRMSGITDALQGASRPAPLEMKTSLEPQGGKWVARWKIRNQSEEPVYLVAQLPTVKNGRIVPQPHKVYLRAQEDTLHLTKRLWRIPRGIDPFIQELPYLVRMVPGQVYEGVLGVPSSLKASYPYRSERSAPAAKIVSKLVISFGYFTGEVQPQASKSHPDLFTVPYGAIESQSYVTSEPHAVRLVVR
ncbi:MAG: hypothetical protein JKY65_32560 [Planctomycetes bacterium]|nr:hypothetical protein [Planctomycetota bacterium]